MMNAPSLLDFLILVATFSGIGAYIALVEWLKSKRRKDEKSKDSTILKL